MSERFIPCSPEVLQRTDLHAEAILLYEFLVDNQTSADGRVFYGKPVGYAWIQSRYLRSSLRSLQRHMSELKSAGFVQVFREFHGCLRIRLPRSIKFKKAQPPPAVQLSLLSPEPTTIRGGRPVDNPVDKQFKTSESPENKTATVGGLEPPRLAVERSKEPVEEQISAVAVAHGMPALRKSQKELDARRRLLQDQKVQILKKYKSAG